MNYDVIAPLPEGWSEEENLLGRREIFWYHTNDPKTVVMTRPTTRAVSSAPEPGPEPEPAEPEPEVKQPPPLPILTMHPLMLGSVFEHLRPHQRLELELEPAFVKND